MMRTCQVHGRLVAAGLAALFSIEALAAEPAAGHIERLDARLDQLISADATVETVVDGLQWCEGPVWDRRSGSLFFSDVPRNSVYRWRPAEGAHVFLSRSGYTGAAPFEGREPGSNGLTLDSTGRLVLAQHGDRSIARRESNGRLTILAARHEGRRLNSPNDLVFRSNGDLYFTDPPFGLARAFDDPGKELPWQGVFRLRRDGTLTALITDLPAPNGIAFSPDERTLYVSNASAARPVWMAYPVDSDGGVGAGREFAQAREYLSNTTGLPDGLKVDRHGNLFAAGPGGVHVFSPDGTRLGRIVTGVPTGNVAWGDDGRSLYIAANHRILRLRTLTSGIQP